MSEKPELIQVGELAVGFSENILPRSSDLKGRTIELNYADGVITRYQFHNETSLTRAVLKDNKIVESAKEDYRATSPREKYYFVDFVKKQERASSECLVLDFEKGIATALTGTLPDKKTATMNRLERVAKGLYETAVEAEFKSAALDKPFDQTTPIHQVTEEMIGRRVKYVYSKKDAYEHIYLNQDHYTWHCLSGIEKGMADTDLCHYYKIADSLFLFVWREKLVPTLGVVMVNFDQMKSTGKIFGYHSDNFTELTNFPIGAYAQLLNITTY